MRKKYVLTALAIFAVTGVVNPSQSLAGAWWVDISDRHVVDRGGLEWNPLIHTVQDTSAPRLDNPEYQTMGQPRQGPNPLSEDPSRRTRESGSSGSSSNESGYGPNPSDNYLKKESSAAPTGPFGETIYGQPPTTPSADPLVRELSR